MARNKSGVALHRAADRGDNAYFTPLVAIQAFMSIEREHIPRILLEPCCGSGNIVLPLREAGYTVIASDLNDYGCPDSVSGLDFLEAKGITSVDGIVTNPPYHLTLSFIEESLRIAPYVAMLLPINFLASVGRMKWWQGGCLARCWISSRRLPMMHREGWKGKKATSTKDYAWFVFQRGHQYEPAIRWFDWRKEIGNGFRSGSQSAGGGED